MACDGIAYPREIRYTGRGGLGYGDADMAEADRRRYPTLISLRSLTRLTFHGPLSEGRAARLTERLARTDPRTVLDIGCGWGELMLRILEAVPEATGLGLDTDEGDLARGRGQRQGPRPRRPGHVRTGIRRRNDTGTRRSGAVRGSQSRAHRGRAA
jgi:hypothetical protein